MEIQFIFTCLLAIFLENCNCQILNFSSPYAYPPMPKSQSYINFRLNSYLDSRIRDMRSWLLDSELVGAHPENSLNPVGYYTYGSASQLRKPLNLQQEFLQLFNWNETPRGSMQNSYYNLDPGDGGQCGEPMPNLGKIAQSCPRKDFFWGMNPKHMEAIGRLKQIMMSSHSARDTICMAGKLRDRREVNPKVWVNSLMSTVMSQKDLSGMHRPALVEVMPSLFVSSAVMNQARRMSANAKLPGECIVLDGSSGNDNGVENALWYWREDIMLNSAHWYWHLFHPVRPIPINGRVPPRPDRRGELFYYFHHSILGRYHAERLANGLPRVEPLPIDFNTIIQEPYFAHLDASNSGQTFGDRQPFTRVQDVLFNSIPDVPVNITIAMHIELLRRVNEAIRAGLLITENDQAMSLINQNGIDLLGEVIEASVYSLNPNYYGAFGTHNEGHFLLGLSHDPRGFLGLSPQVMTDQATAMRDPVFYRYHTPVAATFHEHKDTLPPYELHGGEFPLIWPGVSLKGIRVVSTQSHGKNELTTFFNQVHYDLSRGLDFNRSTSQGQGPVYVCATHLDHEPFTYDIMLDVDRTVRSATASIRIFMAPRLDDNGELQSFNVQRFRFFPLDYFTVPITPGINHISRRSIDSSLTITWPQRLEELERDGNLETPNCGCGWPHHLLLTKGTPEGMTFDLFVMATNGDEDTVFNNGASASTNCRSAIIFCGIPGQKYPDAKPMGYPFDRIPYSIGDSTQGPGTVETLGEFVSGIPNAMFTPVRITHV